MKNNKFAIYVVNQATLQENANKIYKDRKSVVIIVVNKIIFILNFY